MNNDTKTAKTAAKSLKKAVSGDFDTMVDTGQGWKGVKGLIVKHSKSFDPRRVKVLPRPTPKPRWRVQEEGTGKSGSFGMWNHPRGHVWNVVVRPASS